MPVSIKCLQLMAGFQCYRQRILRKAIVEKHLADFEANLSIEQGKTFLLNGDFGEAEAAFRAANRHKKSLKLGIVVFLTRIAPEPLLTYYRSQRVAEIAFITPHKQPPRSINKLRSLAWFGYLIASHMVETLLDF